MPQPRNLGVDVGTTGGDWLYRHGELVLGPVPATQIVDKLFAGDLDGRSEVARVGQSFRRINEVEFFRVHLAKAEAKQRVDKLAVQEEKKSRQNRNVKIGIVAAISAAFAIAAAVVASYLAIHKPWKDADELAYADLISVEPPVIGRVKAQGNDEELVEYPGLGGTPKKTSTVPANALANNTEKPPQEKTTTPKASKRSPKLSDSSADPDGMQTAKFDQDAINNVVATKQKSLFPCLVAEAQKRPGLSAKIPIEFVIGNDGHVNKVWVDNPDFKTGSLPECLLRELSKWPFKPYEGERATVSLSFKIGKG